MTYLGNDMHAVGASGSLEAMHRSIEFIEALCEVALAAQPHGHLFQLRQALRQFGKIIGLHLAQQLLRRRIRLFGPVSVTHGRSRRSVFPLEYPSGCALVPEPRLGYLQRRSALWQRLWRTSPGGSLRSNTADTAKC